MMSLGTPACFACRKIRPRRMLATGSAPLARASLDMSLPMRPYSFAFRLSCLPCSHMADRHWSAVQKQAASKLDKLTTSSDSDGNSAV